MVFIGGLLFVWAVIYGVIIIGDLPSVIITLALVEAASIRKASIAW